VNETPIDGSDRLIELTADVVSAYVSNNPVPLAELPSLISNVHSALQQQTAAPAQEASELQKPAVPIKKSVTPDYIICLEDGKQFKSLKRHLSTHHGLSPDEYRAKWGLPADYPMVAPNYAAARSALAKSMGLGRKPRPVEEPPAAPARRKRLGLKFS
jgi:predicted transcriptional regulator